MIDKIYGKRIVKNKVTKYQKKQKQKDFLLKKKKDLEFKSLNRRHKGVINHLKFLFNHT